MIDLPKIAAMVIAAGTIGGGALALDKMHVSTQEFEKHLEYQQSRYVLDLKEQIREIRGLLAQEPGDEYLIEYLASLLDELCELRPEDRECS
jgi:hypothetical protein